MGLFGANPVCTVFEGIEEPDKKFLFDKTCGLVLRGIDLL